MQPNQSNIFNWKHFTYLTSCKYESMKWVANLHYWEEFCLASPSLPPSSAPPGLWGWPDQARPLHPHSPSCWDSLSQCRDSLTQDVTMTRWVSQISPARWYDVITSFEGDIQDPGMIISPPPPGRHSATARLRVLAQLRLSLGMRARAPGGSECVCVSCYCCRHCESASQHPSLE